MSRDTGIGNALNYVIIALAVSVMFWIGSKMADEWKMLQGQGGITITESK